MLTRGGYVIVHGLYGRSEIFITLVIGVRLVVKALGFVTDELGAR